MKLKELTKKQAFIMKLIQKKIKKDGFPPTIRELQSLCGYESNNSIRGHLRLLERKKAIKIYPGVARGIKVLRGYLNEKPGYGSSEKFGGKDG